MVFVADHGLRTLMDLKYMQKYKAPPGQNGMSSNKYGRGGEDLVIKVPVGTIIRDKVSGIVIADLAAAGSRFAAARGGNGGWGNNHFSSSRWQYLFCEFSKRCGA